MWVNEALNTLGINEINNFIKMCLRIWEHNGLERLDLFPAKMRIPLRDETNSFISMDKNIGAIIITIFDNEFHYFALDGLSFPSFLLKIGSDAQLEASDVAYSSKSRPQHNEQYRSSFADEFRSFQIEKTNQAFFEGIELAEKRIKLIVNLMMDFMNRTESAIVNTVPFCRTSILNGHEKSFNLISYIYCRT
jgi:hypothetical protein